MINIQSSIRREVMSANDRQLEQTVSTVELIVKQINDGLRQFMTDPALVDFELYSLGNYYNEFDDKYKSDDMQALYTHIDSKAKLLANIDHLRSTSDFIDSIYYIHYGKVLVFTSGYMKYALSDFFDAASNPGITAPAFAYPTIMDVRDAKRSNGGKRCASCRSCSSRSRRIAASLSI